MAAKTLLCTLLVASLAGLCCGEVGDNYRQKRPLPDQRVAELQTRLALETWRQTVPKGKVPDPNIIGRKRSSPSDVWRFDGEMEAPPEEFGSNTGDWSLGGYLRPLQV